MEVTVYTLVDFLKDMAPFNLSYREPRTINHMWVFWSKGGGGEGEGADLDSLTETLTNNNWWIDKEFIISALCNAEYTGSVNVLIQFWVPTTSASNTVGGHCVLTTSNQPFGICRIERGVCEYRKYCTSLEINDLQDYFGSVIGRVFRDKIEESIKDEMLGDFARKCGIRRSLFLPLFKPSSWCCSGVLEISDTSESSLIPLKQYRLAKAIFKEPIFMKPFHFESQESTEIDEIKKALQVVCTTHQLPLAQIWIPCCTSTAMANVDSPGGEHCHSPYLSCSNKFSSSIFWKDDAYYRCKMENFNHWCKSFPTGQGQGIVGKAFLYRKPCFCKDVAQLPMPEYHLSNVTPIFGLTGCCAIWLHSTRTKKHEYVLELFFSPWNKISRDPQRYLELLLATVKKQLPGFKISSVGEESCVEVCEISVNDDEPGSIIISQTFSNKPVPESESFVNDKETEQNEVVGETVIDNGSNILGLEENGMVVCHSTAATNDEITIRLPPMFESLRKENEVVQQLSHDEPTMEEAVRKNELNVGIVKKTNAAVTSSERIFSRAEASEREYRTSDIILSREDLTKHFGKKLDDAAKILNVSRSTMKRALRHHKINKWPVPKRKKGNALRVLSGNKGIEGTYNPSCSDPPRRPATAGISDKTSNSRQEQDVRWALPKRKKDNTPCVPSGNEGMEGTDKGDLSCSDPPPTPATTGISHKTSNSRQEHDVGNVTIKATHGNDTFRFKLPFLSRKVDLVEKVKTRLLLNEGSFNIKYQDEENEWISIACDDDLGECIDIWKGKNKIIKMLVEPITNQAP